METTSQLLKDDELTATNDTLAFGGQSTDDDASISADDANEDEILSDDSDDADDDISLLSDDADDDALVLSADAKDSDAEGDGTPVLTEDDLEDADLSEDEADDIEWDPKKS